MHLKILLPLSGALLVAGLLIAPRPQSSAQSVPASANQDQAYSPEYSKDGRFLFPAHYRTWVFLSSGVDMSYNPKAQAAGHSMFDNVFVNPEAYAAFVKTGSWPDKTVLVLESRMGMEKGSINHQGHYQGTQLMGIEVHVKDEARFSGGWAFFNFEDFVSGGLIPKQADCYRCHAEHAAVDTTFVQFYPTLLPIAQEKKTLSESYLKELAAAK